MQTSILLNGVVKTRIERITDGSFASIKIKTMQNLLFVYGTLRQNFGNHGFLKNAHFFGEAKTQDKFVMHCRGSIPFVSESQAISQIVGEVYEIDDNTLAAIDQLEGCYPKRDDSGEFESSSWYIRKQVAIQFGGGNNAIYIWMYFNEQETQHPIISTGDYKDREAMLHRQDRVWYFAYGSNMDVARMLTRNAPFTRRIKGRVGGHRLVFNKISDSNPGFGFANIIPEQGYDVMGVLYEVNADGLLQLDKYEGVRGGHYFRCQMSVSMDDGTTVEATVYLAHPNKVEDGLTPHEDYFYHLKQGIDILGEGGADYLKQALVEARISGDGRFLSEQDLPRVKEDDSEFDIETMALPVLINGFKSKIFLRDDLWSTRVIFSCDPEDIENFRNMGFNMDDDGFFGTKKFQFIRRGILELDYQRLVVEKN